MSNSFNSRISCLCPVAVLGNSHSEVRFANVAFTNGKRGLSANTGMIRVNGRASSFVGAESVSGSNNVDAFEDSIIMGGSTRGTGSSISYRSLVLSSGSHSSAVPMVSVEAPRTSVNRRTGVNEVDSRTMFCLVSENLDRRSTETVVIDNFTSGISGRLPLRCTIRVGGLVRLRVGNDVKWKKRCN